MHGYIRFILYKEEKLAASPVAKTISIVRRGILATSFSILGSEGTLEWHGLWAIQGQSSPLILFLRTV